MLPDFEKLGVFYLGREAKSAAPVLYDAKDLTTHAVCVGMTGSGKTGLCVSLLEEAAIDGIPALVIDPKGDLANLLLTFPDLDAASFRPWINEDAARQAGMGPDDFAAREAEKWRTGLAEWGQDAARIRRLRDAADVVLYTPGSDAARPVSAVSSLRRPAPDVAASAELLGERASGVASSLLGLLGIDADPVRSREHILLAQVLQGEWAAGRDVDLAGLIRLLQAPPLTRVGVMELESFFPEKDRFELAMLVNNLLASPRFHSWLAGEPIDVGRMLYTETGRPRVAVFSIAHLDDDERMFFVSLLLNEAVAWMRTRSGTSSLRAIIYMDEVFGFLPPTANPPSKRPMLTLLKQARAFGVGVVLATQNPVDLDYKALSNAGTWFIGRLQTERDKKRLADGLASASGAGLDPAVLEDTIGALAPRHFLLHSVHEPAPVVFQSRWALSYLAGPMTREQIRRLVPERAVGSTAPKAAAPPAETAPAVTAAPAAPAGSPAAAAPVLPPDLPQVYGVPASEGDGLVYHPAVMGTARVHLPLPEGGAHTETVTLVAPLASASPDWSTATVAGDAVRTDSSARPGAAFAGLPSGVAKTGAVSRWEKSLAEAVYRSRTLTLFECKRLRLLSKPGESERDFRIRVAEQGRAARDADVEKLRDRYAARLAQIEDRIRRAEQAVAREKDQADSQRMQTVVSVGSTLLSAFLGRKALSQSTLGRAASAARGADRTARQQRDVGRAQESVEALREQRRTLEEELAGDIAALEARHDAAAEVLAERTVRPRKTDVEVVRAVLYWVPMRKGPDGGFEPA